MWDKMLDIIEWFCGLLMRLTAFGFIAVMFLMIPAFFLALFFLAF
jgi:hypothetical protein